jgi:3-phosphoshikimate 1-carboxyvinyltransferase
MQVTIHPTPQLRGEVCAPPSKSYTQRMLIAAALSDGTSKISNPLHSDDTEAALRAVTALGAKVTQNGNCWTIHGAAPLHGASEPVDCGESGATLRFMIPVAALASEPSVFLLGKGLEKRPMEPLLNSLEQLGARTEFQTVGDKAAIQVLGGGIRGGAASLPGDVSSQFVSGLMFACPKAQTDVELTLTTALESKNYVRMTQEVLANHGVAVEISDDFRSLHIPTNQTFQPHDRQVPGDFSSAAFLLVAAALTKSEVTIQNLDYATKQGDKVILGVLKKMGVEGKVCNGSVKIFGSGEALEPVDLDAREIPDLVPVCAALACYADGASRIHDAQRLRLKESDRLASVSSELAKMGADIAVDESSLTIKGPCKLHGATIDPHNDHRIAMACAVAALRAEGKTVIANAECVRKSYPLFYHDLHLLGVEVDGGELVR